MNKLVFKKYEFNNKFSLLELLAFKWKHLKTRELKNKFEWRYEQNPYNKNNPFIYVALNGEQVVGFRAFVIQHFILEMFFIKSLILLMLLYILISEEWEYSLN